MIQVAYNIFSSAFIKFNWKVQSLHAAPLYKIETLIRDGKFVRPAN